MPILNESTLTDATLEWFEVLGYADTLGPHLAPGEIEAERDTRYCRSCRAGS